jgi:hypothetical protein
MKLLAQLAKMKQQKQAKATGSRPEDRSGGLLSPSGWVLVFLILLVAGLGTLAFFEFRVWNKVPPALAGLWEVSEGPRQGDTFEFFRTGTLETILNAKGKYITHRARVALKDKSLWITTPNRHDTGEESHQVIIRELTARSLILEFEKGQVLRLARLE